MSTEVIVTDPKTGGQKGRKDERYDLFPFDALDEVARVYAFGAKKYADDNWLKGYAWRLSFGALLRHVARAMCGEDRDPETGCLHLAHAAWHCLALITFKMRNLGTDDRRPPAPPSTAALPPVLDPAKAWPQVGDRVRIKAGWAKGQLREVMCRRDDGVVVSEDGEEYLYAIDEIERAP